MGSPAQNVCTLIFFYGVGVGVVVMEGGRRSRSGLGCDLAGQSAIGIALPLMSSQARASVWTNRQLIS